MNFYIATDPETGRKIWGKRQDEAKKLDRDFEKRDVDTSQDGLIQVFQQYEDRIAALTQIGGSAPAEAPEESPSDAVTDQSVAAAVEAPPVRPEPEPEPIEDEGIMGMSAAQLAPVVEAAVERLGELGEAGFEAVDAHQGVHGVPGSFSRGVHLLTVICTGEHQLTRLLFRARKKK